MNNINNNNNNENNKKTRWVWEYDMTVKLIQVLYEQKVLMDYNGLDMEADLPKLYNELREKMAELYPIDEFGPKHQVRTTSDNYNKAEIQKETLLIAK